MSESAAGYPEPPRTSSPPYQPGYGEPTYHAQPYGSPYGQAVSAPPQHYGAVQPFNPGVPAMSYPPVEAQQLVSAGGRLGALLLDGLLLVVTLWIGWFVWSMITWSDGQSPAKKLLGHVVADATTGAPFGWGQMALREFCVKGLLGWLLNTVTISIYFWVDSFMCLSDRQRTLHDRMANSVVRYR